MQSLQVVELVPFRGAYMDLALVREVYKAELTRLHKAERWVGVLVLLALLLLDLLPRF